MISSAPSGLFGPLLSLVVYPVMWCIYMFVLVVPVRVTIAMLRYYDMAYIAMYTMYDQKQLGHLFGLHAIVH